MMKVMCEHVLLLHEFVTNNELILSDEYGYPENLRVYCTVCNDNWLGSVARAIVPLVTPPEPEEPTLLEICNKIAVLQEQLIKVAEATSKNAVQLKNVWKRRAEDQRAR